MEEATAKQFRASNVFDHVIGSIFFVINQRYQLTVLGRRKNDQILRLFNLDTDILKGHY